jgi:hypothetical protein
VYRPTVVTDWVTLSPAEMGDPEVITAALQQIEGAVEQHPKYLKAALSGLQALIDKLNAGSVGCRVAIKCALKEPGRSWDYQHGIIWQLTNNHPGNDHLKGIVTLSAQTVDKPDSWPLENIIDLIDDDFFYTKTRLNWICWDFHDRRVSLTHYGMIGDDIPAFSLEGSLDGENWTKLHSGKDGRFHRRGIGISRANSQRDCSLSAINTRFDISG